MEWISLVGFAFGLVLFVVLIAGLVYELMRDCSLLNVILRAPGSHNKGSKTLRVDRTRLNLGLERGLVNVLTSWSHEEMNLT